MNLLLTGAWGGAKNELEQLAQAGHNAQFLQYETDPLPCPYDWVEGVVCNGLFLHHPIENFKNLRYIQLTSAGFDRINMEYVQNQGIEIHNARGVYSIPMAEFVLCGVLQLYKKSPYFHRNQQQHLWEKHRDLKELFGQTVCIIGCGSVGTECAKRFSAFGCNVIGVDLYPIKAPVYSQVFPLSELNAAIGSCDIIVLTLPLTEKTHHFFNKETFSIIKQGAVLVNIARGTIVDSTALLDALDAGHLSGAILDVFENEPLPATDRLWDNKNVIITPHNSFVGENNTSRLTSLILKNLSDIE